MGAWNKIWRCLPGFPWRLGAEIPASASLGMRGAGAGSAAPVGGRVNWCRLVAVPHVPSVPAAWGKAPRPRGALGAQPGLGSPCSSTVVRNPVSAEGGRSCRGPGGSPSHGSCTRVSRRVFPFPQPPPPPQSMPPPHVPRPFSVAFPFPPAEAYVETTAAAQVSGVWGAGLEPGGSRTGWLRGSRSACRGARPAGTTSPVMLRGSRARASHNAAGPRPPPMIGRSRQRGGWGRRGAR